MVEPRSDGDDIAANIHVTLLTGCLVVTDGLFVAVAELSTEVSSPASDQPPLQDDAGVIVSCDELKHDPAQVERILVGRDVIVPNSPRMAQAELARGVVSPAADVTRLEKCAEMPYPRHDGCRSTAELEIMQVDGRTLHNLAVAVSKEPLTVVAPAANIAGDVANARAIFTDGDLRNGCARLQVARLPRKFIVADQLPEPEVTPAANRAI